MTDAPLHPVTPEQLAAVFREIADMEDETLDLAYWAASSRPLIPRKRLPRCPLCGREPTTIVEHTLGTAEEGTSFTFDRCGHGFQARPEVVVEALRMYNVWQAP